MDRRQLHSHQRRGLTATAGPGKSAGPSVTDGLPALRGGWFRPDRSAFHAMFAEHLGVMIFEVCRTPPAYWASTRGDAAGAGAYVRYLPQIGEDIKVWDRNGDHRREHRPCRARECRGETGFRIRCSCLSTPTFRWSAAHHTRATGRCLGGFIVRSTLLSCSAPSLREMRSVAGRHVPVTVSQTPLTPVRSRATATSMSSWC
jgi:hypothetical protein